MKDCGDEEHVVKLDVHYRRVLDFRTNACGVNSYTNGGIIDSTGIVNVRSLL